jgi:hypothetical protein
MTWMHVAAMNTIADHEAGREVSAMRLEAARRLLGIDGASCARVSTEES